jgi:hypothetical protein
LREREQFRSRFRRTVFGYLAIAIVALLRTRGDTAPAGTPGT